MVGYFDDAPNLNIDEVKDWKWMSLEAVKSDITINPSSYTEWFKIIFDKFYNYININNK